MLCCRLGVQCRLLWGGSAVAAGRCQPRGWGPAFASLFAGGYRSISLPTTGCDRLTSRPRFPEAFKSMRARRFKNKTKSGKAPLSRCFVASVICSFIRPLLALPDPFSNCQLQCKPGGRELRHWTLGAPRMRAGHGPILWFAPSRTWI